VLFRSPKQIKSFSFKRKSKSSFSFFFFNSYRRISTAAYATELTALFMPENQEEPLLFEFLNHNYHLLDNPDFSPAVLVPRIMYKILELAGFPPQLDRCIHCNSLMPDTGARWGFDNNQGGVVCPDCGDLKPIVGINELKWLVAVVDELKNRRINRREYNNIYNLLSSFIRYTTRQWLVSEKFLIFTTTRFRAILFSPPSGIIMSAHLLLGSTKRRCMGRTVV
jgi:DNA repair protein RecO